MPEPIVQTGDINDAYNWAIETCNKPNVGYWQKHRYEENVWGITYYDCSSFIWYSLYHSGFTNIGDSAFTTHSWSMQTILPQAGFTELSAEDEVWLPGDILVGYWGKNDGNDQYDFQHTEMVFKGTENAGEGYTMGAHGRDYYPNLDDQVSIKQTLSYGSNTPVWNKYTKLYRLGGGATPYGLSMYQVAAMCGCMWWESKVNPGEYHNNQTDPSSPYTDLGAGLGMWTDLPADTKTVLHIADEFFLWMENHGYDWWDGRGQIQCIIADELNIAGTVNNRQPGSMWTQIPTTSDLYPTYGYLNSKYPTWTSWLEDTQNNDVEELALAYFIMWETPGSMSIFNGPPYYNWDKRRQTANDVLDYLTEHGDDEIDEWYYEIGYVFIPDQKALDNCVLIWQQLQSGIFPPSPHPTPSKKKKKMPIWMMLRYY